MFYSENSTLGWNDKNFKPQSVNEGQNLAGNLRKGLVLYFKDWQRILMT